MIFGNTPQVDSASVLTLNLRIEDTNAIQGTHSRAQSSPRNRSGCTFEPHVRELDGSWGFKHENIFFFNKELLLEEL